MIPKVVEKLCFSFFFLFLCLHSFGQSKQKPYSGVYPKIKADGNIGDWGTTKLLFNKTTRLYYAICNDTSNIYFALKSKDEITSAMILAGGISIAINKNGNQDEMNSATVSFPYITKSNLTNVEKQLTENASPQIIQRLVLKEIKEIKVKGFNSITDSVISKYNVFNLAVGINYDASGSLIYELKIPVKLIDVAKKMSAFSYQIKINGVGDLEGYSSNQENKVENMPMPPQLSSPISFWGTYILN